MILGLGFGGAFGALGMLLHMTFHSVTKPLLFFCAGNVQQRLKTDLFHQAKGGVIHATPVTGSILMLAMLAVTGTPPFSLFQSEFTILRAAVAGNAALDALNVDRAARSLPALQHGVGLHVGDVQYGNIGADRRLDFTVIGRAVNLASRIESLTGKLGRRTLASADLALLAHGGLEPVGSFELKGLPGEHVVYGL